MYLYKATLSQGACEQPRQLLPARKRPPDLMTRTVGRELVLSAKMRAEHKDTASATLQIKGPKQAEALQYVEVRTLREQLRALPDGLLEEARRNYSLTKNNQQKCLQDFQCQSLIKIEEVLKSSIKDHGEDVRKYRIGGHDKATYGNNLPRPLRFCCACLSVSYGHTLLFLPARLSSCADSRLPEQSGSFGWSPCK